MSWCAATCNVADGKTPVAWIDYQRVPVRSAKFPLGYLRPYWYLVLPVVISILMESAFYSGLPFSYRYVIDYGLIGQNFRLLVYLIGGLAAGSVLVAALGFIRDYLYARLVTALLNDLRAAMFDRLQRLSIGFFARNRSGDILARFSTNLTAIEKAAMSLASWAVIPGLDVLLGTILLFLLNWKLALVALLVWPLMIAGPSGIASRLVEESDRKNQEEGHVLGLIQENVHAQIVVKAFDLAEFSRSDFLARLRVLGSRIIRVAWFSSLVERSAYAGIMILQVALLAIGAFMVWKRTMTVGGLASFQAVFLSISNSLATVTQYFPTLVQAGSSLHGIEDLLWREPIAMDKGTQPLPGQFGHIVFDDVTFGYHAAQPSLNGLTTSIPLGSFVGIVGTSGSGKSTMLTLLMRLYDPDQGLVAIDGRDVREFRLDEFRSLFGFVPQESFLFDISIRENIRLGNIAATDAEVEAAARAAEIHNAIQLLPRGYDTPAGERGSRLSGGQRQRIALARALVRNPAILVLDEATSALDPIAEAAIRSTLERLRQGRTIVSVTHRLDSVVSANHILVLDEGRLLQHGTHGQLLDHDGPYRRLWTKQHRFQLDAANHQAAISIDRLRLVPVFYGMPDDLISEAVRLFQTEEFPKNKIVIRHGEIGASLFIIVRGRVELSDETPAPFSRPTILEDGDCFGERALLDPMPELENVRTLTECVFLTLNRAGYNYLRRQMPQADH